MFRAQSMIWIGQPSVPGELRSGVIHYKPGTLWPFKIKDCDATYYMGEDGYKEYLAEKEILRLLDTHFINTDKLLVAIEKYGQIRYEHGREDVEEDWAERDAGASL